MFFNTKTPVPKHVLMIFSHVLQFGYIVLTTSAGIMDHDEARRKNVGGKVLGFFY
jgi:small subunit ribosomal protein S15Ae